MPPSHTFEDQTYTADLIIMNLVDGSMQAYGVRTR